MLVLQTTHNLYFYYCDFDINPLKDNKHTSKTHLLPWVKNGIWVFLQFMKPVETPFE
jgi:hypothetical protein